MKIKMKTAYLSHPSDPESKLDARLLIDRLSGTINIINPFDQYRAQTHNPKTITEGDITDVLNSDVFILFIPNNTFTLGCGAEAEIAYMLHKPSICLVNKKILNHYWIQRWFGNWRYSEYSDFEFYLKRMI